MFQKWWFTYSYIYVDIKQWKADLQLELLSAVEDS